MKTKKKVVKAKKRITRKSYIRGKISLGFLAVGLLALAVLPTVLLSQNRVTTQQKASGGEAVTPTPLPLACGMLGDANADNRITNDDAILVTQWVANWTPSSRSATEQLNKGDVDGDGRLTSVDALLISRFASGKEYTFKGCNLPTTPKSLVCGAYGDLDGDSKLSLGDANDIANAVIGNKVFNDYQKKQADVNADGKMDMVDALMVGNLIADKPGFKVFAVCTHIGVLACGNLGDVDSDGIISELDAIRLGSYVVGNLVLTEDQKRNADADSNGKVDMVDALMVARYAKGLDPILRGCTVKLTPTPRTLQSTPTSSPTPFIYRGR